MSDRNGNVDPREREELESRAEVDPEGGACRARSGAGGAPPPC